MPAIRERSRTLSRFTICSAFSAISVKLWPGARNDARRANQLSFHIGRQELLDHLPAELRLQRAARNLPSVAEQRQHVARLVESEAEAGEPLMLHQLQEMRFRQPFRVLRIESVRAVLDGIGAVERHRLRPPRAQPSAMRCPPAP